MTQFKKVAFAFLMVFVVGMTAACGSSESDKKSSDTKTEDSSKDAKDEKIVFEDQLGKTIELDKVPEKVCTTIMPFPYIYYAVVGNNDNLIGCNPSSIVAYEDSVLEYMYPELADANTDFLS